MTPTDQECRLRRGLEIILAMRSLNGESLIDAQMIAAMTLYPADYPNEALEAQGLLP